MESVEKKKLNGINTALGLGIVILMIVGMSILLGACLLSGDSTSSTPTIPQTAPAQPDYRLQLLSSSTERSYSYITLHGQVKNICNTSMENVEAIVTYYADGGTFVKSDSALIDYNPILPNQISPFQVITTDNPAIKTYQVEFKFFWGASIPTNR